MKGWQIEGTNHLEGIIAEIRVVMEIEGN